MTHPPSSESPDLESGTKPSHFDSSDPSYASFSQASLARFLNEANRDGKLGSGPAESSPASATALKTIILTVPWIMLISQAIWSGGIMMIAWAFRNDAFTSLSVPFWTSSFLISSSVVYGVGWALFVLLGFFIREASNRHRTARSTWNKTMSYLRMLLRNFILLFPDGYWHRNDRDRILAHFMAYPIALKMMLRGEREREQLQNILHPRDVDDVINSKEMHVHCIRVIRAYLSSAEVTSKAGFQPQSSQPRTGTSAGFFNITAVDEVDAMATALTRIAEFKPAVGYVNHLRIFLYIWLLFLPLALVETSGWFTVLWAVLITYGIGMLFVVAEALNEPFGYDIQDIRLNRLASADALRFLNLYHEERDLSEFVKFQPNTPHWLEQERVLKTDISRAKGPMSFLKRIPVFRVKKDTLLILSIFLAWLSIIVFLTRGVSGDRLESSEPSCRWWCLYIPLSVSTTSYVGLGVFLLMGFWMNDAYARYWSGLQLWETIMKPNISRIAFSVGFMCKNGTWHERDVERIFSHIAAIPYAGKQKLRGTRDLSEFESILAPEDIAALSESKDSVDYLMRVLYAYFFSMDRRDKEAVHSGKFPLRNSPVISAMRVTDTENVINACKTMQAVPISPSFTLHLHLFASLWLALLPLAFVEQNGFLSYLYLPPIAYSIIKLLMMGNELADPFGTDPNDIPLDMIADEIKDMVHEIYQETKSGPTSVVRESDGYSDGFKIRMSDKHLSDTHQMSHITLKRIAQDIWEQLPPVSLTAQFLVSVWIVAAVFISYGLSFTWDDDRRNTGCREWCSPSDVDKNILLETGFALFLILSFRASDAMDRYQSAGSLISHLETQLRSILTEAMNAYQPGTWHKKDKEKIFAHLVQIPLFLRDKLLGTNQSDRERVISDEDYEKCIQSSDPMRYCLQVVEGYLLSADVAMAESGIELGKPSPRPPNSIMFTLFGRIYGVDKIISQLKGIKRFPVVKSYTSHQKNFTALWLILLPFGMTARTGFFTILWAPLISYGILALESLATTLVDPLGDDKLDIPVNEMFTNMAANLIEATRSAKWDFKHHVIYSPQDGDARIGSYLDEGEVKDVYDLPQFVDDEVDVGTFAKKPLLNFSGPKEPMTKQTLFAHMARSVPWWSLLFVGSWTAVGVFISYVSRTSAEDVRWWESRVTIDGVVVTYVGFPAFLLLGFFVRAAFTRYLEAGNVWGDDLRAACHSLAAQWLNMVEEGRFHKGDRERVLGHLAAVPIALKMELRDERDVRELKGLLSEKDLGRLLSADSMSEHCVDVIRAYYLAGLCRPDAFDDPSKTIQGVRVTLLKYEVYNLQEAIRQCKFLKSFPIARGFMLLLRALIIIWFILIPFVLAESNGWFSILWVPLIGYGIIGMYSIAGEIQQPFGRDLNDFDMDKMADVIVSGVMFVYQNHRNDYKHLVLESVENSGKAWENFSEEDSVAENVYEALSDQGQKVGLVSLGYSVLMALHAVPIWMLIVVAAYSGLSVVGAWGLSRRWPLNESCSPAFCVPIAIDSVVKEYVGFALFLLLGFRLYDSHWRYVMALEAWRDGILANTRMLSNRIFESYPAGTLHKGDLERISAHLAAFSIVTTERLRRNESCSELLKDVMSAEDIARMERVHEKGDYCVDVVRGYLTAADETMFKGPKETTASGLMLWMILMYLGSFKDHAAVCERMISIPLPFGYVQHIRIFLVIWLATLPFGLVETSGWWTTLWVVIIAYGVIGIERWSTELADPFGTDLSDLPLGRFRIDTVQSIRTNLRWFYKGNESVVRDRPSFPGAKEI